LLLAEAFWMMEGYFVRTLGMHRVYNSAFMNMLKNEENEKYRQTVKNTLEFDPQILKRFVNFMNNPDEETAVTQFGTGDKYFGVATLLATMPGLPMFGHGQLEGLAEKYGMEFRRPYWDETPDEGLLARHEHEIFPLLRRRELFASASNFRLYDLDGPDGLHDNVFVYSNAHSGDHVLVAYNNSYEPASGRVRESTPFAENGGSHSSSIADALALPADDSFLVFQEQRSGLWYLRPSSEVRSSGLHLSLDGYQSLVFWKIHTRERTDELVELEQELGGRGAPDIDLAIAGLRVKPLREAFASVARETLFAELNGAMQGFTLLDQERFDQLRGDYADLLRTAASVVEASAVTRGVNSFERHLSTLVSLPHHAGGRSETTRSKRARGRYYTGLREHHERRRLIAEWLLLVPLADQFGTEQVLAWGAETWAGLAASAALDGEEPARPALDHSKLLRTLIRHSDWAEEPASSAELMRELLGDSDALAVIGFNTHAGVEYYHLESMIELLWSLFAVAVIRLRSTAPLGGQTGARKIETAHRIVSELEEANERAQGRAQLLLMHLSDSGASAATGSKSTRTTKPRARRT
ncbi:MAG: hypothetical protein ACOC1U_10370, partial [Spirochaetota bacterium]